MILHVFYQKINMLFPVTLFTNKHQLFFPHLSVCTLFIPVPNPHYVTIHYTYVRHLHYFSIDKFCEKPGTFAPVKRQSRGMRPLIQPTQYTLLSLIGRIQPQDKTINISEIIITAQFFFCTYM